MSKPRFPDVSGILSAFDAGRFRNGLAPRTRVLDFERKYKIASEDLDLKTCEFQTKVYTLSMETEPKFRICKTETFAGVDEGFVVHYPNDEIHTHRIRFGSNRSPKWMTKISKNGSDNTQRERTSTKIPYEELAVNRERVLKLCKLDPKYEHMLIGQSGQFWFVEDCETGQEVEIALYKAGRVEPDATSPLLLLAEIAPWTVNTLEEAQVVLLKYEEILGLTEKRVQKSNVELFAQK